MKFYIVKFVAPDKVPIALRTFIFCTMKKLVLGTVQLGTCYGINNQIGQPSEKSVFDILRYAQENNINTLDTAEDYGSAQAIIGKYHLNNALDPAFSVISKISHHFSDLFNIRDNILKTISALQVSQLEAYLFHSFTMYKNHTTLFPQLERARRDGIIGKIGVSIYTNDELMDLIENDVIDIIQVPFNLLDNASCKHNLFEKAKLAGKEIHVRSAFLQGLFFMSKEELPLKLSPLLPYLEAIKMLAKDVGISVEALALQYVYSNEFVDKVLIGVESVSQLDANVKALQHSIDKAVLETVDKIKVKETWLLNPVNWK